MEGKIVTACVLRLLIGGWFVTLFSPVSTSPAPRKDWCHAGPGCLHGGTCTNMANGAQCHCVYPYTGENCESKIPMFTTAVTEKSTTSPARGKDWCHAGPGCLHGGTCTNMANGAQCHCVYPYTGENCESRIPGFSTTLSTTDSSTTSPASGKDWCHAGPGCLHGGTCTNMANGAQCHCVYPYTGESCDSRIPGFSTTVSTTDSSTSTIPQTPTPPPADLCAGGHQCHNGGTCMDDAHGPTCLCPADTSGQHCEQVLDDHSTPVTRSSPSPLPSSKKDRSTSASAVMTSFPNMLKSSPVMDDTRNLSNAQATLSNVLLPYVIYPATAILCLANILLIVSLIYYKVVRPNKEKNQVSPRESLDF